MDHIFFVRSFLAYTTPSLSKLLPELQKRADQSVLFFLAGANFWEEHAKNCAVGMIKKADVRNKHYTVHKYSI